MQITMGIGEHICGVSIYNVKSEKFVPITSREVCKKIIQKSNFFRGGNGLIIHQRLRNSKGERQLWVAKSPINLP